MHSVMNYALLTLPGLILATLLTAWCGYQAEAGIAVFALGSAIASMVPA